jgi:phosphonopyruvate decarboxylase
MTREQAIQWILDKHGPESIYIFPTGYISRTASKLCADKYHAFYMQGSMGMAPAIGLGIALNTTKNVVVVNGDGALLMSLGTTHTIKNYAPKNYYHYVLDNESYESVGRQKCLSLNAEYDGVTRIIKVEIGGKDNRVHVEPSENTKLIKEYIASESS